MTTSTLLVHVDNSPESGRRLGVAFAVCRTSSAHLVGLYLDETPTVAPALAAVLPADAVERYQRHAADRERSAEERFGRACREAGVATTEWRAPGRSAVEVAVAEARCADLAVLSQPEWAESDWGFGA